MTWFGSDKGQLCQNITKTYLYNFDPLKPHFYTVKLGFTGAHTIFLISAKNIDCGYSLEPPRRGGSNEYPQSIFWVEKWKNIRFFLSENFQFLVVRFSIYLNRRVFVMIWEKDLELRKDCRPRPDCTSAQSDLDFHFNIFSTAINVSVGSKRHWSVYPDAYIIVIMVVF